MQLIFSSMAHALGGPIDFYLGIYDVAILEAPKTFEEFDTVLRVWTPMPEIHTVLSKLSASQFSHL